MSSKKCAGCLNTINTSECMNCFVCRQWYDLDCANLAVKQFRLLTDGRNSWKCAGCRNKEPKGNNTETPIRPEQPTTRAKSKISQISPAAVGSNITTRNKRRPQSPARQLPEHTEEDDDFPLTGKALRAIINQEISSKLSTILLEQKNLREVVDGFQQNISFLSEKYDELKSALEEKSEKIASLEKKNNVLQESVQNLTKRLNNTEQHARANNIEVQCVPENKSENIINTVLNIGKVIKSNIKDADIAHCTRIAKKDSDSNRPRSILVKFNTPRLRDAFLASAIKFNRSQPENRLNTSHLGATDKPLPIYVVEHLSADNKSLHAAARARAKELGFRFVWVRNGHIFMRKSEDSDRIFVDNAEKLKELY
ncbi:Zinc finger DNA binding protein [Operophtera brumata]|uniref:Zinc finger DNA binding protein n=1 Tax=Operophtera brumata TaxID=104452 RepID=A0A0L7LEU2_OPEBR|nr:Zinc finger DNA binding protein [Operophtera brumata]